MIAWCSVVIIDPLFVRCVNAESCVCSTPSHACEGGDVISGGSWRDLAPISDNLAVHLGQSRPISANLGRSRGASRLHVSAVDRAHSRGGVIADEVNAELVKVDALCMDCVRYVSSTQQGQQSSSDLSSAE